MTLRNIFMYVYNLYWRHNCEYLYSEERTTGGFLRMATNKPPCVIIQTSVTTVPHRKCRSKGQSAHAGGPLLIGGAFSKRTAYFEFKTIRQ